MRYHQAYLLPFLLKCRKSGLLFAIFIHSPFLGTCFYPGWGHWSGEYPGKTGSVVGIRTECRNVMDSAACTIVMSLKMCENISRCKNAECAVFKNNK